MYENLSLRLATYRALRSLGCPHRSLEGNSHPLSFEASDSSCFIVVCYMLQYSTHSLAVFFSTCIEAVCIHGLFKQLPWYLYLMLLFSLYMPTEVNYRYVFLYSALKYNSLSSFSTGKMECRADFQHLMHIWQEAKANQNKHPEGYAKHKKIIAT